MDASGISSNLYDASTALPGASVQSPADVAGTLGGPGGPGAAGAGAAGAVGAASSSQSISQVAAMHSSVNAMTTTGDGMASQLMKMAVALLILDMLMGDDSGKSGGDDPMKMLTAAMLGQALGGSTQTLTSYSSSTTDVSITQTTSAATAQQAYADPHAQPQGSPLINTIA